jgi:hypothetical protein
MIDGTIDPGASSLEDFITHQPGRFLLVDTNQVCVWKWQPDQGWVSDTGPLWDAVIALYGAGRPQSREVTG